MTAASLMAAPSALLDLLALGLLAAGSGLLLSRSRWFRRAPLHARIRPYAPARTSGQVSGPPSQRGGVLVPLVVAAGDRLAAAAGVRGSVEVRLRRAGAPTDPARFRVRQFGLALVVMLGALAVAMSLHLSAALWLLVVLGAPVLATLAGEQLLDRRIADRRSEVVAALPVTAEQLALLIGAGYSLRSALTRLSTRASGAVSEDLGGVVRRIRQGLTEADALKEWAALMDVPQVERLVGVLALHREAGDLAALISQETSAIRAEAHRELIESIERRSQLVWVPVTVATLIPGLVLLAVPFVAAMSRVTGS